MGRAPCCDKANVKKGPWSPEEDTKLKSYIEKNGTGGNWIALPQKIGLKRCGKSCRLRWLNYLRPNIKHGGFTEEEDRIILSLYVSIGSRWSIIAAQLPGRTDNDIKNYWNTRLKKKILGKQRRDQQHGRKSSKLIIKQEEDRLVDHIPYTPNFIHYNQSSYWPPHLTNFPGANPITNYSNPSSEVLHGLSDDHASLQKLLMKANGGHYDSSDNDPQFLQQYTSGNSAQPSVLPTILPDCMIGREMTDSTLYNPKGEGGGLGSLEGQSHTFPPELEELMSSNPPRLEADGLELYYGDYGNNLANNDRSKSDATTCGESSGWGEMSSLVSLPILESDCSVLIQGIGEEAPFEEQLRYSGDD